jgi:hypothetical protein
MYYKSLLLLALVTVVQSDYNLLFSCTTKNCGSNCKECNVLDGGPFKQLTTCADSSGGCKNSSTFSIFIKCKGCSNGKDCSYNITEAGYLPSTGCTNVNTDPDWAQLQPTLDLLYMAYTLKTEKYDWCGSACDSPSPPPPPPPAPTDDGLSAGIIVVIVIAVIGAVAGIGFLIWKKFPFWKQKKPDDSNITGHFIQSD